MNETVQDTRSEFRHSSIINLYKELWHLLKPGAKQLWPDMRLAYLSSLGTVAASVIAPYYLSIMLDQALPLLNEKLFYSSLFTILISLALIVVSGFLTGLYESRAVELLFKSLRGRLVHSVIRKEHEFFAKFDTGDLITRISNDTEVLGRVVFDYGFPILRKITLIAVTIICMLLWERHLGIYTILSIPLYMLLTTLFQKPLALAAAKTRRSLSCQNNTLLDLLSGIREIRFYQQQHEAERRFETASEQYTRSAIHSLKIGEWSYNAMEFSTRAVTLIPFLFGGYLIVKGSNQITVGTLVAYNLFLAYLTDALQGLLYGWTRMIQVAPIIERLQKVLDYPEDETAPTSDLSEIMDRTRIEFRGVFFRYPGGKELLRNFNLIVEPGEKLAIIGSSGSGKSTLIDLLIRQITPDQGEILLDNRAVSSYNLPIYLQQFSYVRQNPYIFRSSVRENIAAGWYGVPDEVIIDAARRVHLHEQIIQMPDGYNTVIGSNGTDLSGGQRQRLALARALVRDPEILLLDEFTSALDQITEQAILDDLFRSFAKQTIICVTHSQTVAARFERIVHLEKL